MRIPDFSKVMFVFSCAGLIFGYGVVVGHFEVFPYASIKFLKNSAVQVYAEKDTLLGLRPTEFLAPARYAGDGVTRNVGDELCPGMTLLTGFFEDGNEMRLIEPDGSFVHRWRVKFFDIFPNPDHIRPAAEIPNGEWNVAVHGCHLLPDGSIVFNFAYKGAAKIDRCGNPVWTIPRMTHHSVHPSMDGGFWIPSARHFEGAPQYPRLRPPYLEDTILKVSAAGEILKEISILEILFQNGLGGYVYRRGLSGDLTHLNDVEELDSSMAGTFPQFAAGDLLLSLRHQSMVLVIDPNTLLVKWYQVGPWIGQHDPDFMGTGKLSIFSNNNDGTPTGKLFGGSSIIEIDPQDRRIRLRYGADPQEPMYTSNRGKHQRIGEHGEAILITESTAGRVLEVSSDDRVVWEYINRYDNSTVAVVTGATRYSPDYLQVVD
jgi:hypothetical protein